MKITATVALMLSLLAFKQCSSPGGTPDCVITPPASIVDNRDTAIQIGLDMSKNTKLPLSANASVDLKRDFTEIYQQVPDKLAGCQMVLQTILCLRQRPDAASNQMASDLVKYISDQNICKSEFQQMLGLH
jgi:hypothetical protein